MTQSSGRTFSAILKEGSGENQSPADSRPSIGHIWFRAKDFQWEWASCQGNAEVQHHCMAVAIYSISTARFPHIYSI